MDLSNMLNHASGSSSTGSHSQLPPLATPEKPAKRARSYDEDEDEREDEGRDGTPIEEDELYITLQTQVVGVQYYNGLVGAGEYVMLRRQPTNQFDSNAIQVINSRGTQVGHIPKTVASLLASLMDKKLVKVEGRMIGQNLDGFKRFKLNMDMSIYARPSLREVLEPELAWATPGQMGFEAMREAEAQGLLDQIKAASKNKSPAKKRGGRVGVSGTGGSDSGLQQAIVDPEIRRLLDGLKKVGQDEKQAAGVMDSLTADIDVSKLPLHPSPPGTDSGELLVDLLPHQSQALQWMISHENPKLPATPEDPAVQFWTKQKGQTPGGDYWLNVATCSPQSTEPVLGRGGILADGMGLGKTLTTLSLILATKKDKPTGDYSNATLIVCPLSVLSNWEKQIHDHVSQGGLTSYTYHGDAKSVTARTLSNYDVVFTTYGTVSNGANLPPVWHTPSTPKKLKSHDGPLLQVKWKRVVADEGHQLRNPKSKMARAFAALQAERRWICTGTPIVNSSADFGSLLTCLKICSPLDNPDYFRTLLSRPLKDGNASAGKLLQALVGQILLRRTKDSRDTDGRRLVDLPPIEYFQVPVQLDEETRDLYDQIQEVSTEALITGQRTANVLSMVTRMRQLCLCKSLVPQSFFDELRHPPPAKGAAVAVSAIPEEKKQELLDKLRQNVADNEDCSICFEAPMNNPNITDCGHSYCLPCIDEWLHRDQICPFCRHAITLASLLALPPDETYVEPPDTPDVTEHRSAKVKELVKYLKVFDAKDKTLVFSQFTSFLNIVAGALKEEGITHCRFDGTMSAKKRQEVIAQFQRPVTELNKSHTPKVMLISLMSGAVGLNLTAASNVFLCDPWWQSAIEAQAIDRVHRMGQRKTVRVFQLIAEDTVEARVLDIQKTKDGIVTKAFEKTSKEEKKLNKKEARYEELKLLLGVKPDATAGAGPSAAE